MLLVEENQSYESVVGSSTAWPYLNSLASQYGLATQYYANTHPSIDNYFMMTAGQAVASNDDGFTATVSVDNLVRHILASGKTWKAYAESLPSVGYDSGSAGTYVLWHNPFAYFSDVRNSSQSGNLVPFSQFATDLANNQLPDFSYILPNIMDDAHTGTPAAADAWLQQNMAPLLASPVFQKDGLLIITFDESFDSDTTFGGGHVATVMIGPYVIPGHQSTIVYQHPSLLRTVMEALGMTAGFPADAATAPDMAEFFTVQGK